jgi:hypothetical protein
MEPVNDDPFEIDGEIETLPLKPPKRNKWQMKPDQHIDIKALNDDWDTVNIICDLYDMGIDLKMIRSVYRDIEKERARDYADDVSALETMLHGQVK